MLLSYHITLSYIIILTRNHIRKCCQCLNLKKNWYDQHILSTFHACKESTQNSDFNSLKFVWMNDHVTRFMQHNCIMTIIHELNTEEIYQQILWNLLWQYFYLFQFHQRTQTTCSSDSWNFSQIWFNCFRIQISVFCKLNRISETFHFI